MNSFIKHASDRTVILIDGNALIHRGFHALPDTMRTQSGELVNAVYGFTSVLLDALNLVQSDYVVCAFDVSGPTFRHELYDQYKAHRKKPPQELYDQIPRVKEVVSSLGIPIVEKKGFEADDLIGTLAKRLSDDGYQVVIVTGDMDLLQLVNDSVHVLTLKRGVKDTVEFDPAAVVDKYSFPPSALIDFKGLRGDPSDNIPGIRGVGEKTAVKLLDAFGSLEGIYKASLEELEKVVSKRIAAKLQDEREMAELSKVLATIDCAVDFDFNVKDAHVVDYNPSVVASLFHELEFRSLLSRLPHAQEYSSSQQQKRDERKEKLRAQPALSNGATQQDMFAVSSDVPERSGEMISDSSDGEEGVDESTGQTDLFSALPVAKEKVSYSLVSTKKEFVALIALLEKQERFVFDTETTSVKPLKAELLGIALSWKEGEAYYVDAVALKAELGLLHDVFASEEIGKCGHHLKYDVHVLMNAGFEVGGLEFDTMIASYLLDSSRRQYGLDALAYLEFGYEMQSIEELIGPPGKKQGSMADVEVSKVSDYACEDADYTWRLMQVYAPRLKKDGLERVFFDLEMPLILILVAMERRGILLDVDGLSELASVVVDRLEEQKKAIWEAAGEEFNVNSTVQLRELLFEKLEIDAKGIKKGKTGYSTAVSELEKMRGRHPIIELLFEYRELEKLRNTYIEPLPLLADKDSRVHTTYNQTVTATGRLSSDSPNLQNIPARTDLGRRVRHAFISAKGHSLVAIDYSQVELRIAASLSGDEAMIAVFNEGGDIHASTAARVYGVELSEVTKEQRYSAKSLNFGVLYGMGVYGFARDAGVSNKEAKTFIEMYQAEFAQLTSWIEEVKAQAKDDGFAATAFGRRRYLPELSSSNFMMRSGAERMAINMPIQGLSADLMKKAMIDVEPVIAQLFPEAFTLLQVHDELIFEVPDRRVEEFIKTVRPIMEDVYELKVPLLVDAKTGKQWGKWG